MNKMIEKKGRSGAPGYAMGSLFVYERGSYHPPHIRIKNTVIELERFETAKSAAIESLKEAYERTGRRAGAANAEIFKAQQMILLDEDYNERIKNDILGGHMNAEWAVSEASRYFYELFSGIHDEGVRAKAMDIKDIANKLMRILTGTEFVFDIKEPVILAATYLSPSELIQIDRGMIKALIMLEGSAYSHVVILAKTMGIPVVLGVDIRPGSNGYEAVIDGHTGSVFINPGNDVKEKYRSLIDEEQARSLRLKEYIGREAVTQSGRKVSVLANIGGPSGAKAAIDNGCEGIGLVRTEFMFMDRDVLPTEEEHFKAYRDIVEKSQGRRVVFRTLDLGADKGMAINEENPALGRRAIRICLTNRDIFIPQLKGLLRAAAYGDVAILYPMITSVAEMHCIADILNETVDELTRDKVKYGKVKQGIMIETPAAAMISDELAKEADFFSIGTNDLTQFSLAIDRQNSALARFYDPFHEGVMRMIGLTIENAHKAGIEVTICGELASDLSITKRLIDMGVDALSVSPAAILPLKEYICSLEQ
ncbi:MAG: phosphoenolpyruvate--protein phosphotransferase [Lachnospiraceae bacterium]|nr:phosphoenolpyruvate--protein phosphotransferase [Lachnospiraceae bacterium]